ncbi:MAG: polysulfide reductase NrfD [Syntrophomonadaceae bacterium]|nr:polysulfide reductase NrfD [Syntrophomonadaceae bacterium]
MNQKAEKQLITQPLFIIFALLAVIGLISWILQFTKGLQLTNLGNFNTWGLYIVGFMIFIGIAAGSLLFSSSAYLFKGMAEYKPYARIAAYVGAIGSAVAAGLFIIVDIGNPLRVWYIIASANIQSPMFWDALILTAYVVIGIVFTRKLILVHEGKKGETSLRDISVVAFIAGLMVTVTSFVFAMQVARPFWHNPILPLSFLVAAVVVGLAMLVIVLPILNKTGYIEAGTDRLAKIGKIAGVALLVQLFIVLIEIVIGLYPGGGEKAAVIQWLVSGAGAPFFWIQTIAILAGIVLLLTSKPGTLIPGAGAAIFGIFMVKYNMLQAQLLNPLITYVGPPGYDAGEGVYLPSLIEIAVSVGIIALGGLLVMAGLQKLHLGAKIPPSSVNVDHRSQAVQAKQG